MNAIWMIIIGGAGVGLGIPAAIAFFSCSRWDSMWREFLALLGIEALLVGFILALVILSNGISLVMA